MKLIFSVSRRPFDEKVEADVTFNFVDVISVDSFSEQ